MHAVLMCIGLAIKQDQFVRADKISAAEAHKRIDPSLAKMGREPPKGNVLEFWGDEDSLKESDFTEGTHVRLKTLGDSLFIGKPS